MKQNSIWKKVILLTFSGLMALHISVAQAQTDTTNDATSSDATEECVIMDGQE